MKNKPIKSDDAGEILTAFRELKNRLNLQDASLREIKSLIENMGRNVLTGLTQVLGIRQESRETGPGSCLTAQTATQEGSGEKLCSLIHPAVDRLHEWQVHNEIKRLVQQYKLQDICRYLVFMRKGNKVLLPSSPQAAYRELVRMGNDIPVKIDFLHHFISALLQSP